MSDRLRGFLGEVPQRYFGSEAESSSRIPRAQVEKLLTDDGQRRLELAERAAADWGRAEARGEVEIVSERFIITPRGMLYLAGLRGLPGATAAHRSLYYVATPTASFDPIVDRVRATGLRRHSAAAVDCRFGHDLEFPWPLDAGLRRTFDAHQILIWL